MAIYKPRSEGSEETTMLTLWSRTSGLQNCETLNFCNLHTASNESVPSPPSFTDSLIVARLKLGSHHGYWSLKITQEICSLWAKHIYLYTWSRELVENMPWSLCFLPCWTQTRPPHHHLLCHCRLAEAWAGDDQGLLQSEWGERIT